MEANETLIRKADFALAQLTTSGLLSTQQTDAFIRLAIDSAVAMPMMTRVDMKGPVEERSKINFASRTLRQGSEATALAVAERSRPTTSKVTLTTSLLKAEVRLSYETMEDSIERGKFEETVRATLAERVALDLEDLLFNGDTTSVDALLKTFNGFLALTTTNTVAGGSATLSRSLLKTTLKTMPSQFRKDRRALRYFTADEAEIDYHDTIGDRATPLGDQHVVEGQTAPYQSIPVVGVPVFPTNLGGGANETSLIFVDPANMLVGWWRDMRIEMERDISAGQFIIVLTMRLAAQYAHEAAAVKTTAIRAV